MALTKITSDGITDGTITGTDLATNIDLVDNQKLRLGTGNDLEIFHNNDNSFINDSGTGQLMIQASGLRLRNYPEGHTQVNCQDDVVELYYNNSKKLETDTNGITVTGNVDAGSGQFRLNDSGRIRLGTAQDFEIYHDGSNSLIQDAGTGALVLSTNQLLVRNAAVNEFLIQAVENAGVKLYHDNSKKIETTSSGVTVTGDLTTTGHIQIPDSFRLKVGNATNGDLILLHDGTDSVIDNATGNLFIRSDSLHLQSLTAENMVVGEANGSVSLYHDNSKKLETTANGVNLVGTQQNFEGVVKFDNNINAGMDMRWEPSSNSLDFLNNVKARFGSNNDLQIYHDGSHSRIVDSGTGRLSIQSNDFRIENVASSELMAKFVEDGAVELYYDNSKKFETTSAGVQVTGNALFPDSGVVQLGASQDLRLYHDGTNSVISNSTGILYLLSDDFRITNTAVNEDIARFSANGAVQLFHNNVERIATSSVGVNVTGNFNVADGILTINHTTPIINFTDNSASNGNDYAIQVNTNLFKIVDTTNSNRLGFQFGSDGNTQLGGNVTFTGDIRANADSTHSIGTNSVRFANGYFDTLYGDGSNLTGISGVTVSGQSDNRVLTATGTTDTLQSEPNFLHDATNCDTTIQGYEALKSIDLIVKNTNPFGNAAGARITIESGSAANTGPQFGMICGSHTWYLQVPKAAGNLEFQNNGTGLNFLMADDGDFHIIDGDLGIGTAGHGIDFSNQSASSSGGATTNAELLDHYEEGEWTPVGNISGVGGVTLRSPNTCRYTRVGRMVHITARFTPSGSSGSSNLMIGGLPFNSGSTNASAFCIMHDGFDEGGSQEPVLMGFVGQSTSNISFYYTRTNGVGWQNVIGTDAVNHEIIFDFCYLTDS